jgi:hypothetical protein
VQITNNYIIQKELYAYVYFSGIVFLVVHEQELCTFKTPSLVNLSQSQHYLAQADNTVFAPCVQRGRHFMVKVIWIINQYLRRLLEKLAEFASTLLTILFVYQHYIDLQIYCSLYNAFPCISFIKKNILIEVQ